MSTCCNNLNDASATVASNDIKQVRLPDDCIVAALTDSPSPYDDFRESMQEMVEEKLQNNGKVEWDFMEAKKIYERKRASTEMRWQFGRISNCYMS
jgi:hypothetical protein